MKIRTGSVTLALVLLAPACGDDKGMTGTETTLPTGTTTGGPTTDTSDPTTTDSGTTGTATEGTTTDDTTTNPTTGTTTGGGGIKEDCEAQSAADRMITEFFCGCQVEVGLYPDLRTCLMDVATDPADEACFCDVIAMDPGNASIATCQREAYEAAAACLGPVMCSDDAGQEACFDALFNADCGELSKDTSAQIELQCYMTPPFMCMSGETIPETWICDFENDCMDGSDEVDCFFMCNNGEQVPKDFQCDGVDDCGDGSDEANCP